MRTRLRTKLAVVASVVLCLYFWSSSSSSGSRAIAVNPNVAGDQPAGDADAARIDMRPGVFPNPNGPDGRLYVHPPRKWAGDHGGMTTVLQNDFGWEYVSHRHDAVMYHASNKHHARRALPNQLLHFQFNWSTIGTKGMLVETLRRFYLSDRATSTGLIDTARGDPGLARVHPESYLLFRPDDCARFFAKNRDGEVWILKYTDGSEGNGMTIVDNATSFLRHEFADVPEGGCYRSSELQKYGTPAARQRRKKGQVAQRYIRNPMLLEGHKSELRLYWLIANTDPWMVYVYPTGTVRRNAAPYTNNSDWGNALRHITNIAAQKRSMPKEEFEAIQGTLKWSFDKLAQYLVDQGLAADVGYVNRTLVPSMMRAVRAAFLAGAPTMVRQPNSWVIWGTDFIVEHDLVSNTLHPFLSEVQYGPALDSDKGVKRQVLRPMITEAADMALEVWHRKDAAGRGGRVDWTVPLQAQRNFRLIYHEGHDERGVL